MTNQIKNIKALAANRRLKNVLGREFEMRLIAKQIHKANQQAAILDRQAITIDKRNAQISALLGSIEHNGFFNTLCDEIL